MREKKEGKREENGLRREGDVYVKNKKRKKKKKKKKKKKTEKNNYMREN